MSLKTGTVKLEKYDPKWHKMFLLEKNNLKKLFGDLAIEIEHVGSTSVEGLSAKPIIDIAVGMKDLKDFSKVKEKFINDPYSVKEDSVADEELIRKGYPNTSYLIHVMEIDSKRYKDQIIFRDYLIKNSNALRRYEDLKIKLAKEFADNRKMYTASKNDLINELLNEAYSELK